MQFYVEILLLRAIAGHIRTNDENMSLATRNKNFFCKNTGNIKYRDPQTPTPKIPVEKVIIIP